MNTKNKSAMEEVYDLNRKRLMWTGVWIGALDIISLVQFFSSLKDKNSGIWMKNQHSIWKIYAVSAWNVLLVLFTLYMVYLGFSVYKRRKKASAAFNVGIAWALLGIIFAGIAFKEPMLFYFSGRVVNFIYMIAIATYIGLANFCSRADEAPKKKK